MKTKVYTIPEFDKNAKRLVKKYGSLKSELSHLFAQLATEPSLGIDLGKGLRKIRLGIASKGKGKSGGARVITYYINAEGEVWLLAIYDKSEVNALTDAEIKSLAKIADDIRRNS